MGYVVRKLPYQKRTWKVQHEVWTPKRKIKDIPLDQYAAHGFKPSMSYEEATARKEELNAQSALKRHQEAHVKIMERLNEEELAHLAYLSPVLVKEFEQTVLYEGFGANREAAQRNKIESHWRAAKRCIFELRLDPPDWEDRKKSFYTYFEEKKISPAYLKKLVRILNLWGKFVSKKRGQFFAPLPYPRGFNKEKIADAYLEKHGGRNLESDPIFPEDLESHKEGMDPLHYHWLYLSVWFGLRPLEIESLRNQKYYRVEYHEKKPVLFVYQSKLKGVPYDQRWKYIPCLRREQVKGIEIIKSGRFGRPSLKPVKARFGEHTNLYGGRKGFEFHMSRLGYRLEDISMWLGHRSIERTWRNYKNRTRVRLPIKQT